MPTNRIPIHRAARTRVTDQARDVFTRALALRPTRDKHIRGMCPGDGMEHCADCLSYMELERALNRMLGLRLWEVTPLDADSAEPPDYMARKFGSMRTLAQSVGDTLRDSRCDEEGETTDGGIKCPTPRIEIVSYVRKSNMLLSPQIIAQYSQRNAHQGGGGLSPTSLTGLIGWWDPSIAPRCSETSAAGSRLSQAADI